jgi:methylenetetrahydrofolate--tRNA-(uracil-5-)-methyltransferase
VIGGGLAGAEAAWQLGKRGTQVDLYEMRPQAMTPAHKTHNLAELVCSNSLKSNNAFQNASGLLKEEMRQLDSLIIRAADLSRVPAGAALAVDRERFAGAVTAALETVPQVKIIREEIREIPHGFVIVATGPLTSAGLSNSLALVLGAQHLYFYDAISPIVTADSIDMGVAFRASRYGNGGEDYLNLPLTRDQYVQFVESILTAEKVAAHAFEQTIFFEGCLPIEEMARRGKDTLAYGPMKPTGLRDPRTGKCPHAVVQLRREDRDGTLYNMVGFQTKMTYTAQRGVFCQIPGLERADFVRFGSLHRNTFIDSPRHLRPTLQWRGDSRLFFAGQITGVEGYVESAATGLLAGINVARILKGHEPCVPPRTTAIGSLLTYVSDSTRKDFQPMNASFGLLPPLSGAVRSRNKKELLAQRALADQKRWMREINEERVLQPTGPS